MRTHDAQRWLAAIVDSSDDAIVGKRLDGTIVSWNKGAERVFGYTAGEMVGQSILKLFPPELVHEEALIIAQLVRGERIDHFETKRVRKDGSIVEISLSVSPILDASGAIVGAAKIARDITEAKRLQAMLEVLNERLEKQALELHQANEDLRNAVAAAQVAREAAEQASRAKSEFLASMSHELRTPLNAISGYADLMKAGVAGELSPAYRTYVDRIQVSQQHLQDLITRVLDFSKLEAGMLHVSHDVISVTDLLGRVEPMVAPQAIAKSQKLLIGATDGDLRVEADGNRTIQILLNLLSNAIKFTPAGGTIAVNVSPVPDGAVHIEVSDTGPGVKPEDRERIFEPFVQLDSSLTRGHQGAGLGLAISRDLARAMHGDLAVRDAPGSGSTFTLTLPRVG